MQNKETPDEASAHEAGHTGAADEADEADDASGRRPGDERHPKEDRHFVTALARGLAVLRCFKSGEERLGNQELAERSRLPKSTVTRLTYTLTKLGYLHHVADTGRYRLGMATLTLGGTTLARLDVKEVSRPLMQELAIETSTQIALGTRDDLSMLYIECCRGYSMVTLRLELGSRIPLSTTAMGRAHLAALPEAARLGLEERLQALDTMNFPRIRQGIRQAIADLAEHGCCRSFGDWQKEIHGIAVPISLGHGLPPMVLSAAGPAQSHSAEDYMRDVRPRLIATVREIERRLGS